MKALVLSDIHDKWEFIYRIIKKQPHDVVFISGDFTYFEDIDGVVAKIEKMEEITDAPIYFVPGNCDPQEVMALQKIGDRIHNVHMRLIQINDLFVVGIGGSLLTPFNTRIEFDESEYNDMLERIGKEVVPRRTIILSHMPPYDTLDKIYSGKKIGSRFLRDIIIEKEPIAVLTGHIHESRGVTNLVNTTIINPGPVMLGFYAIIQFEENGVFTQLKNL